MGRSLLRAYGKGKGCILRHVFIIRGPLYTRYKLTARGLSSSSQSILSNQFNQSKYGKQQLVELAGGLEPVRNGEDDSGASVRASVELHN